jgi:beta-aspartyl-peptidase (threonine type)
MENRTIGIICQGGAGVIEDKQAAAQGLVPAIEEAYRLLRQSARAEEAVVTAVRMMEDSGLFNAGSGSDLTIDGRTEMDAALMTQDGRFGGVCCISGVKNPVLVAERVRLDTDHLLLCGDGAVEFARKCGFAEHVSVTERARRRHARVVNEGSRYTPKLNQQRLPPGETEKSGEQPPHPGGGTVGAVAIDRHGSLACATSTGGIAGRMRGRIGDTAIIGAGTFAGPSGAVSCTGHGEEIMRRMLARDIVDRMQTMPASVAMTLALADARKRKILCGAVGFDARGGFCYGHTTQDMAYGYKVAERLFMFTEEKGPRRAPIA